MHMQLLDKTKSVVILAAGSGKRLDIFETPKPLVKLRNKSLIIHTIERFKKQGIQNFFVVIKKNDKLIKKELIDFDNIEYIEQEGGPKGMLDSMLSIQAIINDAKNKDGFFVCMTDLYFDKNPLPSFNAVESCGLCVLVSKNYEINFNSGANEQVAVINDKIDYTLKTDTDEGLIYSEAGIYHFTNEAYKKFASLGQGKNTVREVFTEYGKSETITPVIMPDNVWFDINVPVDLIRAEIFIKNQVEKNKTLKTSIAKCEKMNITATYLYQKEIKYDVIVEKGIIDRVGEMEIIPHEHYYSPHYIIADKNIDELYAQKIQQQLIDAGYSVEKLLVDPGENSKSMEMYNVLANEMVTRGIDKKSIIISIGGGVVKDLAGFLASTIYRGVNLISFPTTILSQADAAIALKQGVNGKLGKNLFGSYFAPIKIIVDPTTLLTLQERYLYDGLAECIKQSFAQDIAFYNLFNEHKGDVRDIDFLEQVIKKAVALKVQSTSQDYEEENVALVNQYGHEFGHAVEHLSGYKLLHGESVAIGMRVSAELSKILGIAGQSLVTQHVELLKKYKLPVTIPKEIKGQDILNSLRFSKKYHGSKARFVLVDKIGSIWHDGDYYFVTCDDEAIIQAINNSY